MEQSCLKDYAENHLKKNCNGTYVCPKCQAEGANEFLDDGEKDGRSPKGEIFILNFDDAFNKIREVQEMMAYTYALYPGLHCFLSEAMATEAWECCSCGAGDYGDLVDLIILAERLGTEAALERAVRLYGDDCMKRPGSRF